MSLLENYQTASWEVQDPGQKYSLIMKTQEIIGQLASGNLGMYAKVRRAGESQWMPIFQVAEFHAVCPFINSQYCMNPKIFSLNGNVTISNNLQKLVIESARIRASPGFSNRVGFHAPIFDPQFPGLLSTSSKIFRLWDNFWVGPLLTPPQASIGDTNSSFLLYLFALNTFTSSQVHDLHPYDYPIPDEERANLTLAVPAGGLAFNKVRIPVSKHKGVGVHTLTFRTVTSSQKLAKGTLVGAITLGSVVYKQGHRGFSIALSVVPANMGVARAPPSPTLTAEAQLFCWCGRPLKDLFCEGCSLRPFVCECFDGSTTKVSQQFSRLPRLVQESFRSLDLSRVWQKTPAELTAEERIHFGSKATGRLQDTQPSQQAVQSASVSSDAGSAQVSRFFPSPVVRFTNVAMLASVGEPIDLGRVAKALPAAARISDGLSLRLTSGALTEVNGSGIIRCPMAESEESARRAIEEAVRQLRQQKIKIHNEPVIQNVRAGPVLVFLGRGIAIQSLPDHVPNSLYAQKVGEGIVGKYNRAGQIILLKSMEDVATGMSEIREGTGFPPVPIRGWRLPLPHFAYLRIGNPPVIAEMSRSPDIDGNMTMTGFVSIRSIFPSEAAAVEAARNIDRVFEEAGVLGPLTPRDKITETVLASDPRAFDYFADDAVVWAPGFMPDET